MDVYRHKSTLQIFLIVFNASLGGFFFGYMIGVFNPTQDVIDILNHWGDQKELLTGIVTALMPVGAIIGAFVGGVMASKIGRRKTFIMADIIGIIGCGIWLIQGNAPLLLGRLVGGVAVGINSAIVPLYINEISPIKISGTMGSMTQLMINAGILISFVVGLNLADVATVTAHPNAGYWWRFCFGFPLLTTSFRSLCLMTCLNFETIPFLIQKGRDEEAKQLVQKFYHAEHVEDIFEEYKKSAGTGKSYSFAQLFGKKYKSRMIMGILLSFIQQFSGCNAVLFYSNKIFKGDGPTIDPYDETMAKVFTILIGLILVFSSGLAGRMIDRFGRKSLLLIGELLCISSLVLLTVFGYLAMTEPSKYVILVYMFSFGVSLGPIVWVYLPEILPEKGVSLAAIANWVGCGILGLFFPIVQKAFKIQGTFLIFLVCCVLGLIYMAICVKETKGKTADEIEEMFEEEEEEYDDNTKKSLISADTTVTV